MDSTEDQRKRLANSLKILRQQRNWNQNQLAEAAGLSLEAIKRFETCQRWPKPKSLEVLARALEVSIDVVMGLHEPRSPVIQLLLKAIEELEKENSEFRKYLDLINLWKSAPESDKEIMVKILNRNNEFKKDIKNVFSSGQ